MISVFDFSFTQTLWRGKKFATYFCDWVSFFPSFIFLYELYFWYLKLVNLLLWFRLFDLICAISKKIYSDFDFRRMCQSNWTTNILQNLKVKMTCRMYQVLVIWIFHSWPNICKCFFLEYFHLSLFLISNFVRFYGFIFFISFQTLKKDDIYSDFNSVFTFILIHHILYPFWRPSSISFFFLFFIPATVLISILHSIQIFYSKDIVILLFFS